MSKGVELIWSEFRRHVMQTVAVLTSPTSLSVLLTGWLVAVVAGPFGTFQTMSTPLRLVYWGSVILSGVALGAVCRATLLTFCGHWRPLLLDLQISLATTTLLAPLIYTLRATLDPALTRADLLPGSIWVNTLFFVTPVFLFHRQFGLGTVEAGDTPPPPRLVRRLPEALQGARILRLSGSGHNVEVVTDRGTETLRLRLSDAIDEMEPVEGLCTHRSHWVALAAITASERRQGKMFVRLSNGERVPVTRTYAPKLEAAGLIPPRSEVEE
jgi:hypothetical protein